MGGKSGEATSLAVVGMASDNAKQASRELKKWAHTTQTLVRSQYFFFRGPDWLVRSEFTKSGWFAIARDSESQLVESCREIAY